MGSGECLHPTWQCTMPLALSLPCGVIKTFNAHKCFLEDGRPPLAEGHFTRSETPLSSLR